MYLHIGTTNETFQQFRKQDSFRHIMKSLAIISESSGSDFKATTVIQSDSDVFDKSRWVMTFLTNMGVTEILRSFRLVLEGKTDKDISKSSRSEFLEKFLANSFVLSHAEGNTSVSLNRGGVSDLFLLRTLIAIHQKSWGPSFPGRLLCFISICKLGSFKNTFGTISSLSELHFRFRVFILPVQMKKAISMSYGCSTSSWKPWRWLRLELIFVMRDIYINSSLDWLTEFTSSSRSTKFKDIHPWSISQMILKTVPMRTKIVLS